VVRGGGGFNGGGGETGGLIEKERSKDHQVQTIVFRSVKVLVMRLSLQ